MLVGRRRLLLPIAFLGLASLFLYVDSARGQESHHLWNQHLTPQQIKDALAKLAIGTDDEKDPLQKMLREYLQKEKSNLKKEQLDKFIKDVTSNPALMEQLKRLAKERQVDPGRAPKLSPDDLANWAKLIPKDDPTKPPVLPKTGPDTSVPPVTPKKGPDTSEPPVTPKNLGEREIPKVGFPPKVDGQDPVPNPGMPPPAKTVDDSIFAPAEEPNDPRTKSLQAFAAIWERNVGPLDETPEVRRALFDLASSSNGLDLDFLDDKGNSIWDLLKKGDGSGVSFDDFMDGSGGSWKLPNLDFPSFRLGNWRGGSSGGSSRWNWGSSAPRPRSTPSSSGSGGLGQFGFGGTWFPVVVLGIIVLAILLWVLVKNLRQPTPELTYLGEGLGPWPIDPRFINTREDVVKAFEYLSVLICGPAAKTWTHNTIADALSELATTHGETAVALARLYELARYAPLDEPLTHDEVMEARELVCGLAGVSY